MLNILNQNLVNLIIELEYQKNMTIRVNDLLLMTLKNSNLLKIDQVQIENMRMLAMQDTNLKFNANVLTYNPPASVENKSTKAAAKSNVKPIKSASKKK